MDEIPHCVRNDNKDMSKVILFIDTSNNKEVTVSLVIDGETFVETKAIDTRSAQAVLPLLEKLLVEHKLTLNKLTGIEVNLGPGSFTGLRVGVAIANTLGWLLNLPVNGKSVGEQVEPIYS